jgi:hypothetical protein
MILKIIIMIVNYILYMDFLWIQKDKLKLVNRNKDKEAFKLKIKIKILII